ncbi:hypothetical protein L2E82_31324 [Cichorium intybus]|uniref:Uncharacterized protein n=1 Tax=Cichorium intybus TaxID=13427 RepID=A0ACB9D2U3_CICIN|nr:hypothetical protein L2E82_31324 [Cichorium intybus]
MYIATWLKEVWKIATDLLVNLVQVNIGNINELVANKSVTQHVEVLACNEKQRRLEQILRSQEPGSKIIILFNKKTCDQPPALLPLLVLLPFMEIKIRREHVLSQLRSGKCLVLLATNVAARRPDIKDIRFVLRIMYTGLGELAGQVLLDKLTFYSK